MLESYTFESGGRTISYPAIQFRGHEAVIFPVQYNKKSGQFSIPAKEFAENAHGLMFPSQNQLAAPASWCEPLGKQTNLIECLTALKSAFLGVINQRVQQKEGYVTTHIFTAEVMSFEKFGLQHFLFIVRATFQGNIGDVATREAIATRQDSCRREFPFQQAATGRRNGYYVIDNSNKEQSGQSDPSFCRIFGIQMIPTPSKTDPKKTELQPHRII